jgi:hypothetical protein
MHRSANAAPTYLFADPDPLGSDISARGVISAAGPALPPSATSVFVVGALPPPDTLFRNPFMAFVFFTW